MKKLFVLGFAAMFFVACGGDTETTTSSSATTEAKVEEKIDVMDYDPKRGLGKYENVELGDIDNDKVAEGKAIFETKCQSCHKLTDERLVGPGWAGVSNKHKPEWLLNFIVDPDPMIDIDPELQAQLEVCLVRMPNQNISDDEAFALLEFMRHNDL